MSFIAKKWFNLYISEDMKVINLNFPRNQKEFAEYCQFLEQFSNI